VVLVSSCMTIAIAERADFIDSSWCGAAAGCRAAILLVVHTYYTTTYVASYVNSNYNSITSILSTTVY